ncbi:MAG: ATP-grasp domain-containing protein [Candidatus Hodarchaeota archaeon]
MYVGIFSKFSESEIHSEMVDLIKAFKARSIKPDLLYPNKVSVQLGVPYHNFTDTKEVPGKIGKPAFKIIDSDISNLDKYSGFLIRGGVRSPSFEQRMFRRNILHTLELFGKKLLNSPKSIEFAADKYLTSAILQANNLPTPRTVVCENIKNAIKGFYELGARVVSKPVYGSEGRGLIYLDDIGIAERIFFYLASINSVIYLQEFVDHPGRDIRVIVLGGEALCAMYRYSPKNVHSILQRSSNSKKVEKNQLPVGIKNWKTNIHAGGKPEYCPLTDEITELAIKASEALGLELAGIDLIETKEGYSILEANSRPGWQGMMKVQNIDIPKAIVEYFISTLPH